MEETKTIEEVEFPKGERFVPLKKQAFPFTNKYNFYVVVVGCNFGSTDTAFIEVLDDDGLTIVDFLGINKDSAVGLVFVGMPRRMIVFPGQTLNNSDNTLKWEGIICQTLADALEIL